MRLLLDTHVLLWALSAPKMLTDEGRAFIADQANEVVVSAASLWEIAIKHTSHRSDAPTMDAAAALDLSRRSGYSLLAISPEHVLAVATLPPLHGDPFDRILVAQALSEPLRLLTRDRLVAAYSDTVIIV